MNSRVIVDLISHYRTMNHDSTSTDLKLGSCSAWGFLSFPPAQEEAEGRKEPKLPPAVKKPFVFNKSAMISLRNCLQKIGENTRKSSESGDDSIGTRRSMTPEIGRTVPAIKLEPVDVNPTVISHVTCNGTSQDKHVSRAKRKPSKGPKPKAESKDAELKVDSRGSCRDTPTFSVAEGTKSSLLQKYRSKRKRGSVEESVIPDSFQEDSPFSTKKIDEFLESAWLSYSICTKLDYAFHNPHFEYSLTAAEIPESFVRVLSFIGAEASTATVMKSGGLAKMKATIRKEEQEKSNPKDSQENQEYQTPIKKESFSPPPDPDGIVVTEIWGSAEFSGEDTFSALENSPAKSDPLLMGHRHKKRPKLKHQNPEPVPVGPENRDPFSLKLNMDTTGWEPASTGLASTAVQSSLSPPSKSPDTAKKVLDAEEFWQLRRLCELSDFCLEENTNVPVALKRVSYIFHKS